MTTFLSFLIGKILKWSWLKINFGRYKKEFKYEEWIQRLEKESKGIDLQKGRVPSDVYFMIDNNIIVGAISIRHKVDNDFLLSFGGHIGYGIRPSQRNNGYGKEILKLGLIKCKELNINKVLVTCLESNLASNKIIISCGGKFENKLFLRCWKWLYE